MSRNIDENFENTTYHHHDTLRKAHSSPDCEDLIPIPLQIFLWRQSSPFLKRKFGTLTESSAIIFDRVLVQNYLHGLSPSLTDAISSIPRHLLIKAAFPHVIYACSSVIEHNLRSAQQPTVNSALSTVVVTTTSPVHSPTALTHLQVSSSHPLSTHLNLPVNSTECQSNQSDLFLHSSTVINHSLSSTEIRLFHTLHYLILQPNETNDRPLSLNEIQLFIYLFIPYIHTYLHDNRREFLSNSDLAQGMHLIWQPLFEFNQPNVRIFNAFVKPNASINNQPKRRHSSINGKTADDDQLHHSDTEQSSEDTSMNSNELFRQDCSQTETKSEKNEDSNSLVSDNFNVTSAFDITTNLSMNSEIPCTETKQAPIVRMSSLCSVSSLSRMAITPENAVVDAKSRHADRTASISMTSISSQVSCSQRQPLVSQNDSAETKPLSHSHSSEFLLMATYFDIAIIRTLFSPSWLSDGYLWCLEYLNKRMINISDEILSDSLTTGTLPIHMMRLKSTSTPQMNAMSEHKNYKLIKNAYFNEQTTFNIIEQQCTTTSIANSIRESTKLLNIPFQSYSVQNSRDKRYSHQFNSLCTSRKHKRTSKANKIHYIDEEIVEHLDLAESESYKSNIRASLSSVGSAHFHPSDLSLLLFRASIVNTTEMIRQSVDLGNEARKKSAATSRTNLKATRVFSASDSDINYRFLEEVEQAHGSNGYINRNGTINFGVVLAGIHAVICKENNLKVCRLALSVADVLLGLAVISSTEDENYRKQLTNSERDHTKSTGHQTPENFDQWLQHVDAIEDEKFQIALDIILRILKLLGCSNCQTRARTFAVSQLRSEARSLLNKLRILHQRRFEKCFLNFVQHADLVHILSILHCLCGYCSASNLGLLHYAPFLAKADAQSLQTYSNNFRDTHLGIGPKGVDGFILNIIFKPLLTRLNHMDEYLSNPEHWNIYSECRAFLTYVKENHGGIFRAAGFSSLIDSERKLKQFRQSMRDRAIHENRIRISLAPDLSDDTNETDEQPSACKQRQSSIASQLKDDRRITVSLIGDIDHSVNEHQEESLYVDLTLVRTGLLRLNSLIEACPPGTVPDPQFLNSFLFLDAPVIAKAAFLIECAYYVRCCSLGQWPSWMRMNLTAYRPCDTNIRRPSASVHSKLNKIYQAAAAKMFYIWGDALSAQLESILSTEESQAQTEVVWNTDEIYEDYYNEAMVNRSGHDCPYSLKLVTCLLLYEITSFLRETYDSLPKLSSLRTETTSVRQQRTHNAQNVADSTTATIDKLMPCRRHKDSIASQFSNRSTPSTSNEPQAISSQLLSATIINMNPLAHGRHISFAVANENESNGSNHTIVALNEDDADDSGVIETCPTNVPVVATKRKSIIGCNVKLRYGRRNNSIKLTKMTPRIKDSNKSSSRSSSRARRGSYVSNITADMDTHQNTIESSSVEPSEQRRVSMDDEYDFERLENLITSQPFPWMKVVIRIFNDVSLTCNHHIKCMSNCHEKQSKSCKNLLDALLNMYRLSSTYSQPSSMQTDLKWAGRQSMKAHQCFAYPFDGPSNDSGTEKEMHSHFNVVSNYLEKHVGALMQMPLMILCKASVLLDEEHFSQILPLSWDLLLQANEELSSCAATIIILAGARANHLVDELIHREMENSSSLIRYNAILKFQNLWRFRHQFWIRLESDAHSMMKILPPNIEFVLPSPALGIANLQTVDAPWMPCAKTLVQQVALNQEEVRAVVTTSKTRKKHQQEMIHSALMTEEISKRVARENFSMSTVPMLQAASFEPLLHHPRDEEDDSLVHIDDDRNMDSSVQLCLAHGTFPPVFGAAVFYLVLMLEDEGVVDDGAIVSGAARKALWTCLLDEPSLLIRFFFEKISHKARRMKSLQCLQSLMLYLTDIPPQFAHAIFNYVLGLLLSMVRSPLEGSQELVASGLALLWQTIPYLNGLVLKDLKQILRKEQAEMLILVTGNMPSTKKIVIHGPDVSQIPTQAIISDDTQFSNVLQEALDFFGIPIAKRDRYFLVDTKTQQIHIPDTYVRDFYFFRRNVYPQLSLTFMDTQESQQQLERMAVFLKTTELSKVLFARYLLENTPFNQIHNYIAFFHDELTKSPLFPRKSLESDYNLYTTVPDQELLSLDRLHKYNWIKLISCIFFNMDGKTTTTSDISLYISVINGSFILHCEDLPMLRFCLATYINIAIHFRHIFATNGYLLIMPTFLQVYSNFQSNPTLRKSIEYCCRQFFILHRTPFVIQMMGSVSQWHNSNLSINSAEVNPNLQKVLFRLLIALEKANTEIINDDYSILELLKSDLLTPKAMNVPGESISIIVTLGPGALTPPKVIKSLDFCYADDDALFTLLSCFDVCVSVVAYEPGSIRSLQMLSTIASLLPSYLEYIKKRTNIDMQKHGREEIRILEKLSITMRTLISTSEWLTRAFVEPKSDQSQDVSYKISRNSYRMPSIAPDEDSANRFLDDRKKSKIQEIDELKQVSEFRWPRDTILSIISNFAFRSTQRSHEIIRSLHDTTIRPSGFLDSKSHIRLADIAHTLLKLTSFDPITICYDGIQTYFQKLVPYTNWREEQLRPTLNNLLRRIDRMFMKICKKQSMKRYFDWETTAGILNGICMTIEHHPYIVYLPYLKTLITNCMTSILNENLTDSNHNLPRLNAAVFPEEFSSHVIKIVGRYLLALNQQPNLESLTPNNSWSSSNALSALNYLLYFILPLLLWMTSERADSSKIHSVDISYIVTTILSSLKAPMKMTSPISSHNVSLGHIVNSGKHYLALTESLISGSGLAHKTMKQTKSLLQAASLLGLKLLIVGFSKQLKLDWERVITTIKLICNRQTRTSSNVLSFIDFIVSYKSPIYVALRPFLIHFIHSITLENDEDSEMMDGIQQKLTLNTAVLPKSMNQILNELTRELNQLKTALLDEPNIGDNFDPRSLSSDKSRLDAELRESTKDKSSFTISSNKNYETRSNTKEMKTEDKINDQDKLINGQILNSPLKQKIEKLQTHRALQILEIYHARYQTRCSANNQTEEAQYARLPSTTDEPAISDSDNPSGYRFTQHSYDPMLVLRSAKVTGTRTSSAMDLSAQCYDPNDQVMLDEVPTKDTITPKLRTFRGLKRSMAYLHKSRLTKSTMRLGISNESIIKYNATEEINQIFQTFKSKPINDLCVISSIDGRNVNSNNLSVANASPATSIHASMLLEETTVTQKPWMSRVSNTKTMTVSAVMTDSHESQL